MSERQDKKLTVVLDANVLYPMLLRDTLLWAVTEGCFRAHWSAEILDEVERNLIGDNRMLPENARRLRRHMERYFPDALVGDYQHLIPTMQNHIKDRHVAAVAVAIGADTIVSSNIRDFRSLPRGISVVEPGSFFSQLWDKDARLLRAALQSQSDAYELPKLTPDAIVERLGRVAPEFAALWRRSKKGSG